MHCVIDFTIILELKRYNDMENKWVELSNEAQQGIWRDLNSRHDHMKNFLFEEYGVRVSVIKDRKMECCASDCARLPSFLNDIVGNEFDSQLSHNFRAALSWWRNDVTVHLTISAHDYSAGLAYCTTGTGMAAAR